MSNRLESDLREIFEKKGVVFEGEQPKKHSQISEDDAVALMLFNIYNDLERSEEVLFESSHKLSIGIDERDKEQLLYGLAGLGARNANIDMEEAFMLFDIIKNDMDHIKNRNESSLRVKKRLNKVEEKSIRLIKKAIVTPEKFFAEAQDKAYQKLDGIDDFNHSEDILLHLATLGMVKSELTLQARSSILSTTYQEVFC